MGAQHTKAVRRSLRSSRPCPDGRHLWGRANRWVRQRGPDGKYPGTPGNLPQADERLENEGIRRGAWWTGARPATTRPCGSTFCSGLSVLRRSKRPSMRSLSTFTDRRATASSPGAIDVNAGDRYCESSELSKPTTEMSSGMRRAVHLDRVHHAGGEHVVQRDDAIGNFDAGIQQRVHGPHAVTTMPHARFDDQPIVEFDAGLLQRLKIALGSAARRNRLSRPGCAPTTATRLAAGRAADTDVARFAPSTFSVAM